MKPSFDILLSYLKGSASPQERLAVEEWKKTDPLDAEAELEEALNVLNALRQVSFADQLNDVAASLEREGFFKTVPWYKKQWPKILLFLGFGVLILLSILFWFKYLRVASPGGSVIAKDSLSPPLLPGGDIIPQNDRESIANAETLYLEALGFRQKGELPTAFARIEEALKQSPQNADYWMEGARVLAMAAEKPANAEAWNICIKGASLPMLDIFVLWGAAPGGRSFVHLIDWNTRQLKRGFYGEYAYRERILEELFLDGPEKTSLIYNVKNMAVTPFPAGAAPGYGGRFLMSKKNGSISSVAFPAPPKGAMAIVEELSLFINRMPIRIKPLFAENTFLLDFGADSLLIVSRKENTISKQKFASPIGYQIAEGNTGIAVSGRAGANVVVTTWSVDGKLGNEWTIPDNKAEICWVGAYAENALAYSASSGRFFLLNADGSLSQQTIRKDLQNLVVSSNGDLLAASLNGKNVFYARSETIFKESNNTTNGLAGAIGFGGRAMMLNGCDLGIYKYNDKSTSLQIKANDQMKNVLEGLAVEFLQKAILLDNSLQRNITNEFEKLKQHPNFMFLKKQI